MKFLIQLILINDLKILNFTVNHSFLKRYSTQESILASIFGKT
jgi:hypothetical protein